MSDKLAWGLISTGRISGTFAKGLVDSKTGYLLAVGSRSQESADKFGDEFNVPRRYGSYEALLADPGVQAVYISTPHPMHAEWAVKSAEAGKHILCEKPLTLNFAQTMAVIDAVKQNDVFLMEAFMYRCSAQTAKLAELIREKVIGDVKIIQATFSFHAGFNPEGRLFKNALGGGGILDVGCYAVSMARMVAGANSGKPFIEPIDVKGFGHLGETGVDEYTSAVMLFPGDIIAQVSTGVALNQENAVRIFGSAGNIYVPSPWFGGEAGKPGKIVVNKGGQSEEILVEAYANQYTIEADIVAKSIKDRQAPPPAMTWDDSLGNMKACDRWRKSIGLTYEIEKPDANFPTIDGRPLKARSGNNMQYGKLAGLDKPVSRLVIGTVGGADLPFASIMFDEFFRCGGNCFDTAYIYGTSDATLGQWIKNRGIREQVVILAKGGHTPHCNPEAITRQLLESLERMQTDYVDIYIMHRDNPEIPVGEFIDVLNEHQRAGRIRAFGGSNWRLERVQAANEYAASKGLNGFSTVNNNFSLARMIRPPWDGCIASSDAESRAWLEKTQLPLMSWSSTGRGFFVRGDRNDDRTDQGLLDWYSDDNFDRLDRARELAKKKGVEAINIAMAWVLCQPFPTFALFGPANLDEMRISLRSLDIQLTPEEMKWLDRG